MIRPAASLAADDVCVQCRVRRSKTSSNPSFQDHQNMTCTMRKWSRKKGEGRRSYRLMASDSCPELILFREPVLPRERSLGSPVGSYGSDSFDNSGHAYSSRMRRSNSIHQRKIWDDLRKQSMQEQAQRPGDEVEEVGPISITIPIGDVIVVDVMGCSSLLACYQVEEDRPLRPIYVTTSSNGYFEFSFFTHNSHDILLAFLSGSLPPERICFRQESFGSTKNKVLRKPSSAESLDVEGLTAHEMRNRVKSETMLERVRRKTSHMAGRLTELTLALSDCACGGRSDHVKENEPSPSRTVLAIQPEQTPSSSYSIKRKGSRQVFDMLDPPNTSPKSHGSFRTRPDLRNCKIPSGMSMEESTKSLADSKSDFLPLSTDLEDPPPQAQLEFHSIEEE